MCSFRTCQQVGLTPALSAWLSQWFGSAAGQTDCGTLVLAVVRGNLGGGESAGEFSVTAIPPAPRVLRWCSDSRPEFSLQRRPSSLPSSLLLALPDIFSRSGGNLVCSPHGGAPAPSAGRFNPTAASTSSFGCSITEEKLPSKEKSCFFPPESRCSVLQSITLRGTKGCSGGSGVTRTRLLFQEGSSSTRACSGTL